MTPAEFSTEHRPLFVPRVAVPYEHAIALGRTFTERQCDRIVDLGCALGPERARVGTTEDEYGTDPRARRSSTAWIPYSETTAWIFDKLASVVERANRTYRFDLTGFTEDIQFTVYDEPGAFFDWHADGLVGELAGRKLSLVVQLSDPDDYAGADLEIEALRHELADDPAATEAWAERARRRGTTVVFPAFAQHRVTRLRSGVRYSLVAWVGGPPFR